MATFNGEFKQNNHRTLTTNSYGFDGERFLLLAGLRLQSTFIWVRHHVTSTNRFNRLGGTIHTLAYSGVIGKGGTFGMIVATDVLARI